MINFEALYGVSYGLYIVSSGDNKYGNGFISNTVFQVTADPPKFAICCNKDNFTAEFILNTSAFSVSILEINTPNDIFNRFGYKSGRDIDKIKGMNILYAKTGVPIVIDHSLSYFECIVEKTIDVGSHWLFIGLLVNSAIVDNTLEPITYAYYRQVKKGLSPKNAPTYIDVTKINDHVNESMSNAYKCSVCGYIYDESEHDTAFANLPEDWVCPICGAGKEDFIEQ